MGKICNHFATFCDSNELYMQYDHLLKRLNFELLTKNLNESEGKILATMLLYFVIPSNLICNMTMF